MQVLLCFSFLSGPDDGLGLRCLVVVSLLIRCNMSLHVYCVQLFISIMTSVICGSEM